MLTETGMSTTVDVTGVGVETETGGCPGTELQAENEGWILDAMIGTTGLDSVKFGLLFRMYSECEVSSFAGVEIDQQSSAAFMA